jgi:uncharacterized cupin superfamily protein
MPHPILNLADARMEAHAHGALFAGRTARIGTALGARRLGYSLTEVPPGKRAWPFHRHHGVEEMFFILEGAGSLRWDAETFPLRAGDCVCAPAGGPAHQIINTSDTPLRYLAVSSISGTDIADFPDSGKLVLDIGDGVDAIPRMHVFRAGGEADYWDGEEP